MTPAQTEPADVSKLREDVERQEKELANNPACIEDTIKDLAALSPIEYDRQREQAAELLGIRVSTLDAEVGVLRKTLNPLAGTEGQGRAITFPDVEEWPYRVDAGELLTNIKDKIEKYVVLSNNDSVAVALFVLFSYVFQASACCPILAIQSPEKRCGKTTLMSLLSFLVKNPLAASNISPAALFRVIEQYMPTLLIDEADSFLQENEELRGVLNSGHTRATAFVIRTTGDNHEPKQFSTWGPKVIALIGKLPDTLSDRSIIINLKRKKSDEVVNRLSIDQTEEFKELKSKCLHWASDYSEVVKKKDPDIPAGLHDRAADNWRALLAIADLAGGEWPTVARKAAKELSGAEIGTGTAGIMLLQDMKILFEQHRDKLPTATIIEELCKNKERPWTTWNRGKPISPRQIAKLLQPFGILPKQIRFDDKDKGLKGYEKDAFVDAFSRYLPSGGNLSETPTQINNDAGLRENLSETSKNNVSDKKDSKSNIHAGCFGVSDKKGVEGTFKEEPFFMEVQE